MLEDGESCVLDILSNENKSNILVNYDIPNFYDIQERKYNFSPAIISNQALPIACISAIQKVGD